jgi:hypothetical protein
MHKVLLLTTVWTLSVASTAQPSAAADQTPTARVAHGRKPNIILVMADDWDRGDVRYNGRDYDQAAKLD